MTAIPTDYLRLPVRLSPTRTELSARCHRRHVMNDLLHLKPAEDPVTLAFGKAVHAATNYMWTTITDDAGLEVEGKRAEALAGMQATFAKTYQAEFGSGDPGYHTEDLGRLLLSEYAKNARLAGNLPGDWVLHEAEQRHQHVVDATYPTEMKVELTYQTDRVVRNTDTGELAIVDTKTASKTSPIWRQGQIEGIQIRCYKYAEQERLGHVDYVLVEGIQKKVTPGQIDYVWADQVWTPEYVREAIWLVEGVAYHDHRLLDELSTVPDSKLAEIALKIALTDPTLVAFNLQDCRSYYRECEYFDICRACPTERVGLALDSLNVKVKDY